MSALSSRLCVKVTMCFLSGRRVEAVLLSDEHVITVRQQLKLWCDKAIHLSLNYDISVTFDKRVEF